jgi:uncharacterized protein
VKIAAPFSTTLALALGLFSFFALSACDRSVAPAEKSGKTLAEHFDIKIGQSTASLQIAVLPIEQQHGLMHRRDLKPNEGMVFVYRYPQQMSFWMRNTPTPLDIGFFNSEGVLLEVHPLLPFDETPVKSRSEELKYAVELPQGWYAKNEVRPGARLDTKALAEAIKARGFEDKEWR